MSASKVVALANVNVLAGQRARSDNVPNYDELLSLCVGSVDINADKVVTLTEARSVVCFVVGCYIRSVDSVDGVERISVGLGVANGYLVRELCAGHLPADFHIRSTRSASTGFHEAFLGLCIAAEATVSQAL